MGKLAIDFGTTNTVVAAWREATEAPETLRLPGLSAPALNGQPTLVPSLLYILDGQANELLAGRAVQDRGYDVTGDERLFTSFKRGIAASARPLSREIDGVSWGDDTAGRAFLANVFQAASQMEGAPVEELVLTVPVQSFEKYLKWLRDGTLAALGDGPAGQVRIVDEATAAALGYDVRAPGELILVFDFGGGTLDVALVRMPFNEDESGLLVELDRRGEVPFRQAADAEAEARVIAKAGTLLGGDDIDNWLIDELLTRNALARDPKRPTKSSLVVVLIVVFLLGIGVTFAEPAIGALQQVGSIVDAQRAPYLWAMLNLRADLVSSGSSPMSTRKSLIKNTAARRRSTFDR